jgi:hypothetical protein
MLMYKIRRYIGITQWVSELGFGCRTRGFRTLGFRTLGFRTLGFRTLGFRTLGFRTLGFRTLGFRTLGFRTTMEMMARVSTSDNLYLIQTVLRPKRY